MAKILIVDDSPDLLQMLRLVLEERGGHKVTSCAEGKEALRNAFADPPDLAILDVMMPGMTGYEVCRRLRENPLTSKIAIIILTARAQLIDQQTAMQAGADAYLAKPITMSELLEHVNGLLSQKGRTAGFLPRGVVVMLSLRGGVGVTTLATNLAVLAAQQAERQVCLVDLSFNSGHAALQLGIRPNLHWGRLAGAGRPTWDSVRGCLLAHRSSLALLASPFTPALNAGLSAEEVRGLLQVLCEHFTTVVVDAAHVLDSGTLAALEMAASVGLVLTSEPCAIQTTAGTLQVLQSAASKLHLVVNQVMLGGSTPLDSLQRTLRRDLISVPFDPAHIAAVSRGEPLAIAQPNSAYVQALRGFAASLLQ